MKVRLLLGNAEIAEVRTSPNLSGFATNQALQPNRGKFDFRIVAGARNGESVPGNLL